MFSIRLLAINLILWSFAGSVFAANPMYENGVGNAGSLKVRVFDGLVELPAYLVLQRWDGTLVYSTSSSDLNSPTLRVEISNIENDDIGFLDSLPIIEKYCSGDLVLYRVASSLYPDVFSMVFSDGQQVVNLSGDDFVMSLAEEIAEQYSSEFCVSNQPNLDSHQVNQVKSTWTVIKSRLSYKR